MELTEGFKVNVIETAKALHGHERRLFMARTAQSLGHGGQRRAEAEFGWSRVTIRKGMHELRSGITCCDASEMLKNCYDNYNQYVVGDNTCTQVLDVHDQRQFR